MTLRVLAYHSHNISGDTYATNDHVALASDLGTLCQLGARIVPLEQIAQAVREGRIDEAGGLLVGLSFDDGPVFDIRDFEHPRFGPQRSFAAILRDFAVRTGHDVHATSFVIASPEARRAMERAPDCGFPTLPGWLGEDWWRQAADSSMLAIGNHSWDHVHHAPSRLAVDVAERDNFALVRDYVSADAEIRRAADYINARVAGRSRLFAFPFGHVNDFLVHEYLPERAREHRMIAAFGVGADRIDAGTSVWNIPRVVCGEHWRSPEQLEALLR
ncbi:MAG TPA: polysaccharide deacetylase family protein [Usitatibacter sp.]|nr:polysaccharide deacetylase family protein [Usitatibacter sp.]